MSAISPKLLTITLCAVVAAALNRDAEAFAFLLDPAQHPNNLFGRELWDVNPANKVVVLTYAFAPNLGQNLLQWNDSTGRTYKATSRGWNEDQKKEVNAAAAVWNAGVGTNNNVVGIQGAGERDLQSTALHEFGHALGLGHPAWVSQTAPKLGYQISSLNVNANGTPFTDPVPANVDKNNIQKNPNKVQVDGAVRPVAPGQMATEAVMVQGEFPNEYQRQLAFDDEQGLHALQSGADFIANTADDFTFMLKEVPYDSNKQLINIVNSGLWKAAAGSGGKTYTSPKTNIGRFKWKWTPDKIDKSLVLLDQLYDPSAIDPSLSQVTGLTEVWQDYPSLDNIVYTGGATIYLDAGIPVPIASTLVLVLGGSISLMLVSPRVGLR